MGRARSTLFECHREDVQVLRNDEGFVNANESSLTFEIQKYFPKAFQLFTEHGEKCIHENLIADFKKGAQFGYFRNDIDLELLARLRMAEVNLAFNPDFYPNNKLPLFETQLVMLDIFMRGILTEKGLTLYTSYQNNLK